MRALVTLAAPAAIAALSCACTFPDVDYADGGGGSDGDGGTDAGLEAGSSSSGSMSCTVPPPCSSAAMSCAQSADGAQQSCAQQCKNNMPCISGCSTVQQTALGKCEATCQSCAMPTCPDPMATCKSLVGM